jgi:hypothetical protein
MTWRNLAVDEKNWRYEAFKVGKSGSSMGIERVWEAGIENPGVGKEETPLISSSVRLAIDTHTLTSQ